MRVLSIAAALLALAASSATAQIGNPAGMTALTPERTLGKPAPHQPNANDRLFYYLVGTGGSAEVGGARSAEKRASDAAVKDFARQMARDHAKANDDLATLAKAANVPLPVGLDPDHRVQQSELDTLTGAAFDRAYMQAQLVDHQKTATLLQWEIASGQDAELQRYATKTLPIVLQHLEMAQTIMGRLTGAPPQGLAATAASSPTTSTASHANR